MSNPYDSPASTVKHLVAPCVAGFGMLVLHIAFGWHLSAENAIWPERVLAAGIVLCLASGALWPILNRPSLSESATQLTGTSPSDRSVHELLLDQIDDFRRQVAKEHLRDHRLLWGMAIVNTALLISLIAAAFLAFHPTVQFLHGQWVFSAVAVTCIVLKFSASQSHLLRVRYGQSHEELRHLDRLKHAVLMKHELLKDGGSNERELVHFVAARLAGNWPRINAAASPWHLSLEDPLDDAA